MSLNFDIIGFIQPPVRGHGISGAVQLLEPASDPVDVPAETIYGTPPSISHTSSYASSIRALKHPPVRGQKTCGKTQVTGVLEPVVVELPVVVVLVPVVVESEPVVVVGLPVPVVLDSVAVVVVVELVSVVVVVELLEVPVVVVVVESDEPVVVVELDAPVAVVPVAPEADIMPGYI